jgi:hypothetical protein
VPEIVGSCERVLPAGEFFGVAKRWGELFHKPRVPADKRRRPSLGVVIALVRLSEIGRVEHFGEPAIDRGKKIAGLLRFSLIAPHPSQAGQLNKFLRPLKVGRECRRLTEFPAQFV